MSADKIIKVIQNAGKLSSSEIPDLLYGEVLEIDPLKIKIDNRFEIDETFLILSNFVKEKKIILSNEDEEDGHLHIIEPFETQSAGDPIHTHVIPQTKTSRELTEIILWRGLEIGDIVRILRINKGQMFYVLEREEESNDT